MKKLKAFLITVILSVTAFLTCTGFTMGIGGNISNDPEEWLFFAEKYHPKMIYSPDDRTYLFEYNELNQITRATLTCHDRQNNRTSQTLDYIYYYDEKGNMIKQTLTESYWVDSRSDYFTYTTTECFLYDDYGNMISRYIPGVQKEDFTLTFDENHRVTSYLRHYDNGLTIHDSYYTYNEIGQVITFELYEKGAFFGESRRISQYSYNSLGDVASVHTVSIDSTFNSDFSYAYTYEYDSLGRPVKVNNYFIGY